MMHGTSNISPFRLSQNLIKTEWRHYAHTAAIILLITDLEPYLNNLQGMVLKSVVQMHLEHVHLHFGCSTT